MIINEKCEVQDFNCTKYSPGNQVGGLPGALHWRASMPKNNLTVKKDVLSKFTNLKPYVKKTTHALNRKKVLETRIEART